MFKTLVLVIAFAAAPLALADATVSVEAGDFPAQRAKIEKDLGDGETYAEISQDDRARVLESLDRMGALLEGGKPAAALPDPDRVELFNAQEVVNTLLTQAAADSRVTCVQSKVIGTHRRTVVCSTAAERSRRRQQDKDTFQSSQRVIPIAQPVAAPSEGN